MKTNYKPQHRQPSNNKVQWLVFGTVGLLLVLGGAYIVGLQNPEPPLVEASQPVEVGAEFDCWNEANPEMPSGVEFICKPVEAEVELAPAQSIDRIEEDDPAGRWDCRTMGNQQCGETPAPVTRNEQLAEDVAIDADVILEDDPIADLLQAEDGSWVHRSFYDDERPFAQPGQYVLAEDGSSVPTGIYGSPSDTYYDENGNPIDRPEDDTKPEHMTDEWKQAYGVAQ